MKRIAFRMKLNPGVKEEYKKRHSEIWDELVKLIRKSGVRHYSIFYDKETDYLFAIQKVGENKLQHDISEEELMRKWWKFMSDVMETNPDLSPVVIPLEEVFYME